MSDLLAILAILIAAVSAAIAVVVWFFLRKMQRHQDGIYEEISALAVANKRLIERIGELEKRSAARPEKIEKAPEPAPQKATPEPAAPSKEHESLWHDVIYLAKQGLSADTIAKDLNITRGEVELILGLHNFKPKQADE